MQNQEILVNEPSEGKFVFSRLSNLLKNKDLDEVVFMVAFITVDGIYLILEELRNLLAEKVRIVIITGFMNYFNNPKVFELLMKLGKLEIRIANLEGYHPKLYRLKNKNGSYAYIIGSSNLTNNALRRNVEMNIFFEEFLDSTKSNLVAQIEKTYQALYSNSEILTIELLEKYKLNYNANKLSLMPSEFGIKTSLLPLNDVTPNLMQERALASLFALRKKKSNKAALIISATGSGKTYLSAFDVKAFKARKLLFIAHRDNILNSAIASYQKIIPEVKYSKLTGKNKDFAGDYIFASIQTLQKDEYLQHFSTEYFDYLIIDEVHRAGAAGYQKVIDYFKPKFMLGMSATPERNDNFDIYQMFDHNIAYEIRLNEALEEGLVCPFHYFGIAQLVIDGVGSDNYRDFTRIDLTSRVEHIIANIRLYGYAGNKVKGLVFTSRIDEAYKLSELFNQYGYRTLALSGNESDISRERAIGLLSNDYTDAKGASQEYLDYIFSVDIFNEGIDIPCVNQIVLLRPTQSAIVFVQQLGRGLRRAPNKEYCVVIDFIANYKTNFLIAVALSGNNSYDKESLRRFVSEANTLIPLNSTVSFDKITRERIYSSINTISISKKFIDEKYIELKQKLNRAPSLIEFKHYNSIDPKIIFKYSAKSAKMVYENYYELLTKHKDVHEKFNQNQERYLSYISQELLFAARPDEMYVLLQLINGMTNNRIADLNIIYANLSKVYNTMVSDEKKLAIKRILNLETSNAILTKYQISFLADIKDYGLKLSEDFVANCQYLVFKQLIVDTLELGLSYFDSYALVAKYDDFILYDKYSRREVTRLLNVNLSVETSIYGYRIIGNKVPMFITYNKSHQAIFSANYENIFLNNRDFIWYSRPVTNLQSKEIAGIINHKSLGLDLMIFIKKSDNEGSEHYYLGNAEVYDYTLEKINDKNVVKFVLRLENPLPDADFDYLLN